MDIVVGAAVAAAIGIAVAVATLFLGHRTGLSDVTRRADEQTDRLVEALKGRVDVLEDENKRLTTEMAKLERENEQLRGRVAKLEKAITDQVVA